MADTLKLNRINKFDGGITISDKDKRPGVALSVEEIDIFSNSSYIQPETVLSADTTNIQYGAFDYAYDGSSLFALGRSTNDSSAKIKIWKLTSAGDSDPGDFSAYFTSGNDFDNARELPSMLFHSQTESSTLKTYLYYTGVRAGGGTALRRLGDISAAGTTETSTDVNTVTMTLDGVTTAKAVYAPFPRISLNGEAFFGHGQYIAKIDDDGVFTQHAFTLPSGWYCMDLAGVSDSMYILASNDSLPNLSAVFVWDITSTTGFDDVVYIPMGGACMLWNHNEVARVWCVQNNILRIYELYGNIPVETHRLESVRNISLSGSGFGSGGVYFPVLKQYSYMVDNIVHFGLFKTDKCGMYALGQAGDNRALSLILRRRFIPSGTSAYTGHRPTAVTAVGPNIYTSYHNGSAYAHSRLENSNSPSRSSDAVFETILIDGGNPEVLKDWEGFIALFKAMPASCSVIVDAKPDNATSYDTNSAKTLDSTGDQQESGETADRRYYRDWSSVIGSAVQARLRFTSSGTSAAKLYSLGLLSRDRPII